MPPLAKLLFLCLSAAAPLAGQQDPAPQDPDAQAPDPQAPDPAALDELEAVLDAPQARRIAPVRRLARNADPAVTTALCEELATATSAAKR